MAADGELPIGKIILGAVVLIIVLVIVTGSIAIVGAGQRGVVMSFGAVQPQALGEGIHFITPIKDSVVYLSVQTLKYQAQAAAASSDLQDTSTTVALNFHLDPSRTPEIYQTLGLGLTDNYIAPAIQEVVKATTAKFTAEELITRRDEVKQLIQTGLTERLNPRGILVEQVSITDFEFSKQFTDAIEAKVTAQQQALQASNVLLQRQFEASQAIATAEGQANATILNAIADARAIQIKGDALRANPQIVSLNAVDKWNGVLPVQMLGSAPIPFVTIPSVVQPAP